MHRKKLFVLVSFVMVGLLATIWSAAIAQPANEPKPHGQPEMKLPPGWTAEDMQACMVAATPGKMHAFLAKGVGVWHGKNKMWMAPDTEPMVSECVATITPMMDGRFTKCEITGDMPGMGPFTGFGVYGFDNVAQQFQSTWCDNMGTGMMTGTGELSSDNKTLSWNFNFHCPIQKKQVVMREIETFTGPDSKTLEMHCNDPKTGKEYKMMEIVFTRQPGTGGTAGAR